MATRSSNRRWLVLASALLAIVAIMAPTPALGQTTPTTCPDDTCLDMKTFFTTLCTWLANTNANVPQAQYPGQNIQVSACKDVNLLQSRASNPNLFQTFPNLQGQGLRIEPLPFNAKTDLQIQDVQESVVTSSALEIVNANPSGSSISVDFTNSIASSSSASFAHSTTVTSNSAWQVSINLNLPFELGGIAAQYSNSMQWTSMDTDTTQTSSMFSSSTTQTVTVSGGQCVYVISQVLNSQASGTYTLSANLTGLVGMYMTTTVGGGEDVWNWLTPAQWYALATQVGYVPVGAESSVVADGLMRLTSPALISSQRGIINVVPMDPTTCAQKIAAAKAATPSDNAPNGSSRRLQATVQQQQGEIPAVVRDVEPGVLRGLVDKYDRKVRKLISKP